MTFKEILDNMVCILEDLDTPPKIITMKQGEIYIDGKNVEEQGVKHDL